MLCNKNTSKSAENTSRYFLSILCFMYFSIIPIYFCVATPYDMIRLDCASYMRQVPPARQGHPAYSRIQAARSGRSFQAPEKCSSSTKLSESCDTCSRHTGNHRSKLLLVHLLADNCQIIFSCFLRIITSFHYEEIIIDFPINYRQSDNHRPHTINRGDGKMTKKDIPKKDMIPIIRITLLNYDPVIQDEYNKKFMSPLIAGLLKRTHLA